MQCMHSREVVPEEVLSWLTGHMHFVPYLQVNGIPQSAGESAAWDKMVRILGKLTNFLNLNLLLRRPPPPTLVEIPKRRAFRKSMALARKIRFLQMELHEESVQIFDRHIQMCIDLIDLLDSQLSSRMTFHVEEETFYADMLNSDPPNKEFREKIINSLRKKYTKMLRKEEMKAGSMKALMKIIRVCKEKYDATLFMLPNDQSQEDFNDWLLGAPSMDLVDSFIANLRETPRRKFTATVFQLYRRFREKVVVKGAVENAVLVILFFRAVFDFAYEADPGYFFENKSTDDLKIAHTITCAEIEPPANIIDFDPAESLMDVFKRDALFCSIGRNVVFSTFHVNPIDMLNEINLALSAVQAGASVRGGSDIAEMLPFETVFVLFFGSVLTSDLSNFEDLVHFVVDFAPTGRICPAFQYAQVTLSATLSQLDSIVNGTSLEAAVTRTDIQQLRDDSM